MNKTNNNNILFTRKALPKQGYDKYSNFCVNYFADTVYNAALFLGKITNNIVGLVNSTIEIDLNSIYSQNIFCCLH